MSYELILGIFKDDVDSANNLIPSYESAQDQLGITEAVAITRPHEGDDEIKVLGEHKKKARRIGAVTGAVLGVFGGPATMVVLGAAGAALGSLIENLTHAGISKNLIDNIESSLEPGSSAILVIVEPERHHLILNDLKDRGASIINESIESHEIDGKYLNAPGGGISGSQ